METFNYYNRKFNFCYSCVLYDNGEVLHTPFLVDWEYLEQSEIEEFCKGAYEVSERILLSMFAEYCEEGLELVGKTIWDLEDDSEEASEGDIDLDAAFDYFNNQLYFVKEVIGDSTVSFETDGSELVFRVNGEVEVNNSDISKRDRTKMVLWGVKAFKEYVAGCESGTLLFSKTYKDDALFNRRVSFYKALGFTDISASGLQFYTVA